uniref:Uncharacterized protein n=1 Tax=Setaria digitata TaxID=48799 RepID=A0A915PYV5_9BILA
MLQVVFMSTQKQKSAETVLDRVLRSLMNQICHTGKRDNQVWTELHQELLDRTENRGKLLSESFGSSAEAKECHGQLDRRHRGKMLLCETA